MHRRDFFRRGLTGLRDTIKKSAPTIVASRIRPTLLDLSILTSKPIEAEMLFDEILQEHFGDKSLRLRTSKLSGDFPGGILLFENNRLRDFHDGVSLFHAGLKEVESHLVLSTLQTDPTLLRYSNVTPLMSRSVEVFHRDLLVLALPLSEDGHFTVQGSLGPVEVRIEDGHCSILTSPCRHQICVAHPPIIAPGQRITCFPSQLTAVIGSPLG